MDDEFWDHAAQLSDNYDRIPHGVSFPLIKERSIDDVPILALTLHSAHYDHLTLRRLAAQVDDSIKQCRSWRKTSSAIFICRSTRGAVGWPSPWSR